MSAGVEVTVHIAGLAELTARLKRLPVQLQKTIVRKAIGAGAQVIKKAAIARTPIGKGPVKRGGGRVTQPGVLRSAALVKFIRERSNDQQAVYIITYRRGKKAQRIGKNATNKDAFYASFVEFGHRIVPRTHRIGRDRRGRFINQTTIKSRRGTSVGKVEGRRMLTQAFNASSDQALDVIVSKIRSGFDAAVRSS